ncbi:MAG: DUF3375 domain-containing protein [Bacteroidia bacterium]
MNFDQLKILRDNSPSIILLRAQNSPLILSFLYREFISLNTIRKSNTELVRKLSEELEQTEESIEENDNINPLEDSIIKAKKYLEVWTNKGYLLKSPDETGEHWHELTTDSVKTLRWVEDLLNRQRFVGTNSRFKDIFQKIKSLVDNSTSDPDIKIKELEEKKQELQKQIDYIKQTGKVDAFDNTQIEEEFSELNRQAKSLLADFRQVDENFKKIARDIYEKQSAQVYSKGGLLGLALDAWSELRQKDQGKSFYAFWEFLQSDASKEEYKLLIDSLYTLLKERNIDHSNDQFLRFLKKYLHEYGKRVLESNDKLAEKLNRLLAEKSLMERKRAMELIQDIRLLALKTIEYPPDQDYFVEVETFEAEINLPLARKLNYGQHEEIIRRQPTEINDDEEEPDFSMLYKQFVIDKKKLENNIRVMLKSREEVTLGEVLKENPIEKGLAEVVTYFSIASQQPRSIINRDEEETISLDNLNEKKMQIPKIIFKK